MCGVTLLVLLELPQSIRYHSPFLYQHTSQTHLRCITIYNDLPLILGKTQDWSRDQALLQLLKAGLTSTRPSKPHTLPDQLCQWYRNLGESLHETSIITDQTREFPHLGYTRRSGQFFNASILPGSTKIPSFPTTCPRKATCGSQNSHLLNLAYKRCSLYHCSTSLK